MAKARARNVLVPEARIHVVLEPRKGTALAEVLSALHEAAAEEIDQISEGFISAEVKPETLSILERVAYVEEKKPFSF